MMLIFCQCAANFEFLFWIENCLFTNSNFNCCIAHRKYISIFILSQYFNQDEQGYDSIWFQVATKSVFSEKFLRLSFCYVCENKMY